MVFFYFLTAKFFNLLQLKTSFSLGGYSFRVFLELFFCSGEFSFCSFMIFSASWLSFWFVLILLFLLVIFFLCLSDKLQFADIAFFLYGFLVNFSWSNSTFPINPTCHLIPVVLLHFKVKSESWLAPKSASDVLSSYLWEGEKLK